jgi:serine kinase of HPr protein (carbohydrate metabolism regulator)
LSPRNLHATAIVLGDRGLVITGPSGSGKTTLAFSLLQHAAGLGLFSAFVADDQVLPRVCGGRLIVDAPAPIAGLAEVFGLGPRQVPHVTAATVDLVVDLVPPTQSERLPEPAMIEIYGVAIPQLRLPARNIVQARLVIAAWLGWPPCKQ